MLDNEEIHSLEDFQRRAKAHLQRLRRTGQPCVLTVKGKARVVVQDAVAYRRMLALVDYAAEVLAIRRGLDDVSAGRTRPVEKAFRAISRRLGIPAPR